MLHPTFDREKEANTLRAMPLATGDSWTFLDYRTGASLTTGTLAQHTAVGPRWSARGEDAHINEMPTPARTPYQKPRAHDSAAGTLASKWRLSSITPMTTGMMTGPWYQRIPYRTFRRTARGDRVPGKTMKGVLGPLVVIGHFSMEQIRCLCLRAGRSIVMIGGMIWLRGGRRGVELRLGGPWIWRWWSWELVGILSYDIDREFISQIRIGISVRFYNEYMKSLQRMDGPGLANASSTTLHDETR